MATGWSSNALLNATVASPAGLVCKQSIATALRRFSYRFTTAQIAVLADLYATALEQLEPEAVPAVRKHMCDPTSEEARARRRGGAGRLRAPVFRTRDRPSLAPVHGCPPLRPLTAGVR